MPENRSSLAAYARTQYVLTYSPSTPSRIPENCLFSGMLPQPAGWDTCMPHAMHYQYHIGRYADAQTCTEARYGPVYDAKRAARAPAINYKIAIVTTLGHTGTNKSMGASIRRAAATHGYRTPHHPTTWARVHRCLSTPWEQPAVAKLDTPTMRHATNGR